MAQRIHQNHESDSDDADDDGNDDGFRSQIRNSIRRISGTFLPALAGQRTVNANAIWLAAYWLPWLLENL